MTENEKLRSLLAEARRELARHVFTQESPVCVNCGGESGFDVGRACPYAADYDLKQRIDAALAEPVLAPETNYYAEFNKMRDKAAKYGLALTQAQKERDEARAEAALAYQRGAEAMREAAAGKAYTTLSLHDEPCRRSELRQAVVHAIEALPIPEDKR